MTVTGTYISGHKRDFEVTVTVQHAAILREKVSFLSLIGSPNSPGGVPRRTHVSRREVVGDTLNLRGKSQRNHLSGAQSK